MKINHFATDVYKYYSVCKKRCIGRGQVIDNSAMLDNGNGSNYTGLEFMIPG